MLEDGVVGENGAKMQVTQEYSPTCPRIKLWRRCL